MAWWQKKLLRYALSRTGFLDDNAIDLDNLDVAFGKRNVFHFKDVGLNIKRISKLAQLPPGLRVETARILSLRLVVPADIYQSSILVEVDGIDLNLQLEEQNDNGSQRKQSRARTATTTQSPQHRKVQRRIHPPPAYDPGGLSSGSEEEYLPTAAEMAKSFLFEEPVQERAELEASLAPGTKGVEESVASESSDGTELGTGAGIGLPGFLAGFLQGIVDRLQVSVKNVEARIETNILHRDEQTGPLILRLRIAAVDVGAKVAADALEASNAEITDRLGQRHVKVDNVRLGLSADTAVLSDASDLASQFSPTASRQQARSRTTQDSSKPSEKSPIHRSEQLPTSPQSSKRRSSNAAESSDAMRASAMTADSDRFADAGDDRFSPMIRSVRPDLDIQPGDDNISWASRRSQSDAPNEDLWNSMASEDDLPDSLLLDHAPLSRERSSQGGSPSVARSRRNVSPYSRSIQTLRSSRTNDEDDSAVKSSLGGPGSWPAMEQSQASMFQSMMPDQANHAVRNLSTTPPALDDEPESTFAAGPIQDLSISRVFSHAEAQSMYMSAMTQRNMHVPGGWGSDTTPSEPQSPVQLSKRSTLGRRLEASDEDLAYDEHNPIESKVLPSGPATPRQASPAPGTFRHDLEQRVEKSLIHVDTVKVWLPAEESSPLEQAPEDPAHSPYYAEPSQLPGTFSAYSEMSGTRRQRPSSSRHQGFDDSSFVMPPRQKSSTSQMSPAVEIGVGALKCQVDLACARVLYLLAMRTSAAFQTQQDVTAKTSSARQRSANFNLHFGVKQFSLSLKEMIDNSATFAQDANDGLFTVTCDDTLFSSRTGETGFEVGSLGTLLGKSRLLRFDRRLDMGSSTVVTEETADITIRTTTKDILTGRSVKDINVQTLPLDLHFDLAAFDDIFASMGGLSAILEAGSSILSDNGISNAQASPPPTKGVRFETEYDKYERTSEVKLNIRVGGINAALQGEACSMHLRTSSLKAICREHGISASIDHATFSGPHLSYENVAPMSTALSSARLEYLNSPNEKDLDRLLSLLVPSKDRYDDNDDILIETLLRQRRKGAVARINLGNVKARVHDWASLTHLTSLVGELSKLSAVAKYLPEDERPGLFSLVRVKDVDARLPVNDRFGKAHVTLEDFSCAHVGLPALLSLSIGKVKASQNGEVELLQPLSTTEALPMVMMRTLGDEFEPLVKVKLYNICVEYSVPVVVAAAGLDLTADREEVLTELAQSIASMATPAKEMQAGRSSPGSQVPSSPKKRTRLELLIHDCGIGLQPVALVSKGMVVLTDARIWTSLPATETVTWDLELRKAALFVAAQVIAEEPQSTQLPQGGPANTTTSNKITALLCRRGYVSVGSLMAAKINVKSAENKAGDGQATDVDVRSELLLLETCADSTQTMLATLNGLTPPTPPAKQPKYLTEPMTIEGMMASFTGEPQVKQERPPSTLFDAEEAVDEEPEVLLNLSMLGDYDDGLLGDSEMAESLYGPVSGMLEGVDKPQDDGAEEFPETVESLLEDDPFEMPDSPADANMSDAVLIRELNKQCKTRASDKPVDLGLYEVEDLGFDALGGGQQLLGQAHRFNTPASRKKASRANGQKEIPLRLRVRDMHIIWNIYDGYDWKRTREGITEAVEQVELKAEERKARRRQSQNEREDEESVIGDFLFNSIYIGVPSNHDAQELRRQINKAIDDRATETESMPVSGMSRPTTTYSASGRPLKQAQRRRLKLERSKAHKVAFELKGVSADVLVFPPDSTDVFSSVDVRVKDFEIFDNIPSSTWRKFLTHYESDPAAREMSKPMMHIEMQNVRTLEQYAASEIVMHVAVLPIRLHVDQDALDFITRFFEFKDESAAGPSSANDQPFIQRLEVDTVDMCLDYKPKRVDYGGIRSGHYTEFKNFVILDGANIKLKHAIVYGIKGFERLHETLNAVWMPDIKRNQLPTVLAGLAPMRNLVNIGSGVRDVVAIPVREYKKDGRIVRSIQKGAMQFGKTTTSELARLGAKVAMGTQTLLTGAEGLLSPASASPSGRPGSARRVSAEGWQDNDASEDYTREQRAISAYANQPLGVFSGLRSARRQLELDLLTAKDALIAVQGELLESGTPGSAAAAVARHAPTVILRPVIGASRAVGTTLLGVGNQIDRGNVRKIEDKYKRR